MKWSEVADGEGDAEALPAVVEVHPPSGKLIVNRTTRAQQMKGLQPVEKVEADMAARTAKLLARTSVFKKAPNALQGEGRLVPTSLMVG